MSNLENAKSQEQIIIDDSIKNYIDIVNAKSSKEILKIELESIERDSKLTRHMDEMTEQMKKFSKDYTDMVREQYNREFARIEEYTNQIDKRKFEYFENISTQIKELSEKSEQHITNVESKLDNKLEKIDVTLKGNGKVGIIESIRNINLKIRIIFICILLLFGGKMADLGLTSWINNIFNHGQIPSQMTISSPPNSKISVQLNNPPSSQPTTQP